MGSQKPGRIQRRQWGGGRGWRPYAQPTRPQATAKKAKSSVSRRPSALPATYTPDFVAADVSTTDEPQTSTLPTRTATSVSFTLAPASAKTESPPVLPSMSIHSSSDSVQTSIKASANQSISPPTPAAISSTSNPKPKKLKNSSKNASKPQTPGPSSQISSHAKASSAKSRLSQAAVPSSFGHAATASLAVTTSIPKVEQEVASQNVASTFETMPSELPPPPASEAIAALVATGTAYSPAVTSHASSSENSKTSQPVLSSSYGSEIVYSAAGLYGGAPLMPELGTAPPTDIATAAKAGIAVGTVCLGSALIGLAIFYFRRQRKANDDANSYKRSSTPSMTCIDGKDAIYHENDDYYPTSPASPQAGDDLRYSTVIDAWGGIPAKSKHAVGRKPLKVKVIEPGRTVNPPVPAPVAQYHCQTLNPGVSLGGQTRKVSAFSDSTARASCYSSEDTPNTLDWQQARSSLRRLLGMSRVSSLSSASDPAFPVSARAKNFPVDENMFLKVPGTALIRESSAPSQTSSASHYPESVRTSASVNPV